MMKKLVFIFCLLQVWTVQAVPFDYMVFQWSESQGLSLYSIQEVDLPMPQQAVSKPFNGDYVVVENGLGEVLQVINLKSHQVQRSEHHGFNQIKDSSFANDQLTFVVRVPQNTADKLYVSIPSQSIEQTHEIRSVIAQRQSTKTTPVNAQAGSSDNRINLLFLGDGYLANQNTVFDQHANAVETYMQTFEPYNSYGQFISFDRLFLASAQEGADHPTSPCGGVTDPQAPLLVNTRFDATYCTSGIHRLLTVNSGKVYTAAAMVPDWDEIVMLVNDSTYGGSGGPFSTISAHSLAADVFIHEFGHSFTDLADEYDSAYPGFPACSDINGSACEANVTDETVRNNLKWNYFVNQATPIPTPDTAQFSQVTGLFEGARYMSTGMYRPVSACNMRYLGSPFCPVCQQAFVHKVYQVPYAAGGQLLSLIEPDSLVPANNQITAMVGSVLNFSIGTLQPEHDLSVSWLVNGNTMASNNSSAVNQTFDFVPQQSQVNSTVTIKVEIKDISPLVHPSLQAQLPVFEQVWMVDVIPFADLIFADGFEN